MALSEADQVLFLGHVSRAPTILTQEPASPGRTMP